MNVSDQIQNTIVGACLHLYAVPMFLRTSTDIGHLVREQRKKRGWTQAIFAKRLSVSRLWVVQLEQGKETLQLGLVLRALNELEMPIQIHLSSPTRTTKPESLPSIDLDEVIRECTGPMKSSIFAR